jgi:hypothetical protein
LIIFAGLTTLSNVTSTDLDDIGPFGTLCRERIVKSFHRGEQALRHIHSGGDVHRRRKLSFGARDMLT